MADIKYTMPQPTEDKDVRSMADIKYTMPPPTEDTEQMCLFRWADAQSGKYPELSLMYHIPNGGKRGKAEAGRFRAMGVKSGVPDIFLPFAVQTFNFVSSGKFDVIRIKYHGLYIELKRLRGGTVSATQKQWISALRNAGYAVEVCKGWEAAAAVITDYLEGRYKPQYQP